jgi:glutathione S-transferase
MLMYYTYNLNPRLGMAVAKHLGVPMAFRLLYRLGAEEKAAFGRLAPMGRAPVLVEEGRPALWETDAIACRLSTLAGSDFWRSGDSLVEMIRWVSWATQHLNRAADALYFNHVVMPTFTKDRLAQDELDRSLAEWHEFMAILDAVLAERDWLVDDRLSYADFRTGCVLPFAEQARLPLGDYPNVARWHRQLLELAAWRDPFEGLE